MMSLQEYKGEQLTKEEIDLLELYDTIRKQQAAEAREKRSSLAVLAADANEDARKRSGISGKDDGKIKRLKAARPVRREQSVYNDVAYDQLDPLKFAPEGLLHRTDWRPQSEQEMVIELPEFGFGKNQTLAVKISVPDSSKRWSFNICPPEHNNFEEILYHFNPRRFKRDELVENDKVDGAWGRPDRHPLNQLPQVFDGSFELMIQITADAFHTTVDGQHATSFFHRRDVSELRSLTLNFPLRDDYGSFEEVTVHQVWWGVKDEVPFDYFGEMFYAMEQDNRTNLFVNGLPIVEDGSDRERLEEQLYDIFQEYSPVGCRVVPGKGYAFIKVQSPDAAASAIHHLHRYDMDGYILAISYAKQRFKAT